MEQLKSFCEGLNKHIQELKEQLLKSEDKYETELYVLKEEMQQSTIERDVKVCVSLHVSD